MDCTLTPNRTRRRDGRTAGLPLIVLAGFFASAGLPLYIHLPRFATETGLSLAAMGGLLLAFRVIDLVQDPLLGALADRMSPYRPALAGYAVIGTGVGFFLVFTLQPGLPGLIAGLFVLFTAFSLGTILFYGQCVSLAADDDRHFRIAGRRETGTLSGIIVAALLPTTLGAVFGVTQGYAIFGWVMLLVSALIWRVSRQFWTSAAPIGESLPALSAIRGAGLGPLLAIALINALPVALTSSLFLFFVEDRLGLPHLSGLYLVLFFAAAGLSAPVWSRLSTRFGPRRVLLAGMTLAVLSFLGTAALPGGAAWAFAAITVMSGIAIGADMVILPAMFSVALSRHALPVGTAFGAWFFAGKLALALAAATALPLLDRVGYVPGGPNTAESLGTLTVLYAIVPCVLKLPAMMLVARLAPKTSLPVRQEG